MKRSFFIHFSFLVSFFLLISVINSWLYLSAWMLWLGGLIGSIIPELDRLIYVFFVSPQDFISQRFMYFFRKRNISACLSILNEIKPRERFLIFHSPIFLIVSFILLFWLATSSNNLLGLGIGLSLVFHQLVSGLIIKRYSVLYLALGFGILLVLAIIS